MLFALLGLLVVGCKAVTVFFLCCESNWSVVNPFLYRQCTNKQKKEEETDDIRPEKMDGVRKGTRF